MLAHTPLCDDSFRTDLGEAFEKHLVANRMNPSFSLGMDSEWLNVIRTRALAGPDAHLTQITQEMLDLLADPESAKGQLRSRFQSLYDAAGQYAYPLAWALRAEKATYIDITRDYTLECIDFGMVRRMEDATIVDSTMQNFVDDMHAKLSAKTSQARHAVLRQVFDVYSEALVYYLLKLRGGNRIKVDKISKSDESTPDFSVDLDVDINGQSRHLSFFVEVKTLDIVHAPQRLPEMLMDGVDRQIELEDQVRAGTRVAITFGEVAPYRPYGSAPDYDPYSVRQVIETLIEKSAGNFKQAQFRQVPTFALVSLLRLPLPGQGTGALAPFFYDNSNGGACVSGALWHMAFGSVGAHVHKTPRCKGAGTADGTLRRAGILVDPVDGLPTPALVALHFNRGAYRLDGLFNSRWTDSASGWSDIEVEAVIHALCDDYNDQDNSQAYKYSMPYRRA